LKNDKVGDCYSITATVQDGPDQTRVIIPVTVIVNLPDSASASASPEEGGTGNQASAGKKDKQAAKAERKAEKQAEKEAKQEAKQEAKEANQEAKEEKKNK
jgi:hypothetical protein